MEKYIPDIYQKSIYEIDYLKLSNQGIKCLLFDLDNTLVPFSVNEVNKRLRLFFSELKQKDFDIYIFSNSHKSRVKNVAEELNLKYYFFARKPLKGNYKKVMYENDYNESQVAIIGDQILTDILGGNLVGITTILVNQISPKDSFVTKITRILEKIIIKRLRTYELFVKGKYYD